MTQYTIQGERFPSAAAVADAFLGANAADPAETREQVDSVVDDLLAEWPDDLTHDDGTELARALREYYGVD